MTYSYRRLVLHPFVVLLMLVAMIFATAADAAACGCGSGVRSMRRSGLQLDERDPRQPQMSTAIRAIRKCQPINTAFAVMVIVITARALLAESRRNRFHLRRSFLQRLLLRHPSGCQYPTETSSSRLTIVIALPRQRSSDCQQRNSSKMSAIHWRDTLIAGLFLVATATSVAAQERSF